MKHILFFSLLMTLFIFGCKNETKVTSDKPVINNPGDLQKWIITETVKDWERKSFGYDLKFLRQRKIPILLYDENFKSMVLVSPEYQGRVITSTADGLSGQSFGWVNYDLIGSGEYKPNFNPFGGEDRIWIGPEGGQFSFYFKPKSDFTFDNWQVPGVFDKETFEIVSISSSEVSLFKRMLLTNYSDQKMDIVVSRRIKLISPAAFLINHGVVLNDKVKAVGFESLNVLRNNGANEWTQQTGMPSIWILGMFKPNPSTTVVIPYKAGNETAIGPVVNDVYFGKPSADRLIVDPKVIYFKADGRQRSKIGLSTFRALPISGSYDEENKVLTIVEYSKPDTNALYVNSLWKIQDKPFNGDVINAYNDGPLENGTQLGPFYEIESSSPAAALKKDETIEHTHRTLHFTGDETKLNEITLKVFGVTLDNIKNAFK